MGTKLSFINKSLKERTIEFFDIVEISLLEEISQRGLAQFVIYSISGRLHI